MIQESAPWKNQLVKDAGLIERWASKPRVTERRSTLLEQKIFLSAYAMRKLSEGKKLSSNFDSRNIKAERFGRLPGRELTWWKTHCFQEIYDLSKPNSNSVAASILINTIIHSNIYGECLYSNDDHRICGFFVTSDLRDENIWLVPLDGYVSLMRIVGNDYQSHFNIAFNEQGKHYTWRGHGDPPTEITRQMEKFRSSL